MNEIYILPTNLTISNTLKHLFVQKTKKNEQNITLYWLLITLPIPNIQRIRNVKLLDLRKPNLLKTLIQVRKISLSLIRNRNYFAIRGNREFEKLFKNKASNLAEKNYEFSKKNNADAMKRYGALAKRLTFIILSMYTVLLKTNDWIKDHLLFFSYNNNFRKSFQRL